MFFKQESGLAAGTELYNWSDAARPTPNEDASINFSLTDGWDEHQNVTLAVSSIEFENGLYSVEITATGGASDIARLYFTVESGASYRLTYWAKVSSGGIGRIRGGSGWVSNPDQEIFSEIWEEYTTDVVATGTTGAFQFYATFSGGATGQKTFIDNVTMIKL